MEEISFKTRNILFLFRIMDLHSKKNKNNIIHLRVSIIAFYFSSSRTNVAPLLLCSDEIYKNSCGSQKNIGLAVGKFFYIMKHILEFS